MKIELQIPTDVSEITLQKYQKFVGLNSEGDNDEFIAHKLISIFCGIELKNVRFLKATDVISIVDRITLFFNQKHKFVNRFEIGGKEFGFIPNLENISMDEFVQLDTFMPDWSKMHKALAVMYRPITKTNNQLYEIEDYNSEITYEDVMLHAPLNVVFGAMVFFWNLKKDLLNSSLNYLENQMKELTSTMKNINLTLDGDGITHSINLVKETLEDLEKLENYRFINV
jgi:hypothetical protein